MNERGALLGGNENRCEKVCWAMWIVLEEQVWISLTSRCSTTFAITRVDSGRLDNGRHWRIAKSERLWLYHGGGRPIEQISHLIVPKHLFTAKQVVEVFIERVVCKHAIPKSIITNGDEIFLSNFQKELFTAMGTVLKRSTTFHPQIDGQMKRVNRCLETFLRLFCSEQRAKIQVHNMGRTMV